MPRIKKQRNNNIREDSLDILRGFAVLFMVLAHTIAFFYTREKPFLNLLQDFGDTVCFTTFLLVSGASSYIAYINISQQKWRQKKLSLLKRTRDLLTGYYIVALISSLQNYTLPISIEWIKHFANLILFIEVPGYTEFLLPFIVFSTFILLAKRLIQKILHEDILPLLIGVSIYCIAFLFYWIDVPNFMIPYKALLTGFDSWYRFPIFQYTIVFILGLLLGKFFQENKNDKKRISLFKKLTLITLAFILLSIIIKPLSTFPYINAFNRWPPNISFLSLGLLFSFCILLIVSLKTQSVQIPTIKNILTSLGKRAFSIYLYHIILLQTYNYISGKKYGNSFYILISFLILITISYYLPPILLKLRVKLSSILSNSKKKKRTKKALVNDKLFLISIALLLISLSGLFLAIKQLRNTTEKKHTIQEQEAEIKGVFTEDENDVAETTTPRLYSQINRKWILRSPKEYTNYSNLTYTVNISGTNDNENISPHYKILNTQYEGDIPFKSDHEYEIELSAFDLPVGTYDIQAYLDYPDQTYESNIKTFNISYPIYIVWTMDWEGSDAENDELEKLESFSSRYNLPVTHFFNPGIYVSRDISKERYDYLTDWILERKQKGDEIGVHLHMRYEVVEAAGVQIRTEPHWTDYLNNGHDVPCSEYTQDEFTKILTWTKNEFQKHNLGIPLSFRAGGWFADIEVLQALENTGFLIDSSGRSYYIWGNNRIEGHWRLNSKTQPYQPSLANQNSSYPAPTLSLWEFPNNGADSWFYKSNDLIKRFKDNYTSGTSDTYKVITYLTHPHAFSIDEPQLTPTFDFIHQFNTESDTGPVIYTTLIRCYNDIVNL